MASASTGRVAGSAALSAPNAVAYAADLPGMSRMLDEQTLTNSVPKYRQNRVAVTCGFQGGVPGGQNRGNLAWLGRKVGRRVG